MTEHDPLDTLREQFRAAAARDIAGEQPARPRRRRWRSGRTAAIAVAVVAGTAGLAAAGGLISIGEPKPDIPGKAERYQPSGTPQIAVQAPIEEGHELPFAVAVYEARTGEPCALAGLARGGELGEIENGTFRPYVGTSIGACGSSPDGPIIVLSNDTMDGRLLVFGRARDGLPKVRASVGGDDYTATTGLGGAFLFVFDSGRTSLTTLRVTALDANGKAVN
jgi:hypothetical protein